MSNRKPRIYSHCKAGCNWETIHRSEFESAYPYVPVYLNEDGILNVERNIRYKIYNKNAYTSTYGFKIKINASGTIITIDNPEFDKYQNYVFFKFLDFVPNYLGTGSTAMIYELNNVRGVKLIENEVALVSYSVTFDTSTGEVSGDGTDKFTYTKVQKPSTELLKEVSLEIVNDEVVLKGDTEFVEDYDYVTGLEEGTDKIISATFISITWKTTYTPTENDEYVGAAHTIVSGSQSNTSTIATARYTIPAHYEITDYSWVETYDDYVLSSTSVSGSTYAANYCVFNVYVEDLERALICNDDVAFEVKSVSDGEGLAVIDITNAEDSLTREQLAKLPYCYIKDGELIYHLSYVDVDCWYYENTDEKIYRYLTIYNDGNFDRHEPEDMSGGGITIYTPIREG